MKKTITILFITLVFICAAIFVLRLKKQEAKLPEQPDPAVQKETTGDTGETTGDTEETTLSQEGLGAHDWRFVVDASCLKAMNELCISNDGTVDYEGDTYQFQITSAQKSRTLREDFKEGVIDFPARFKATKSRLGDLISDEGDLKSDYYYLYIDVELTNIGSTDNCCAALDYDLITISEDKVATYYADTKWIGPCYGLETDGKDLINYMTAIMPFEAGESCSYTLCYIIPDEMLKEDNLYIYRPMGLYGKRLSADKEMQYVKLDIR